MKNALEYQRKAEECRQRANSAVHPDDKTGWLHAAEDWQKLARCAEQSAEQRGLSADLATMRQRIEQLAAGQEQATSDIGKLQAAEQEIRHKVAAIAARPVAAPSKPAAPAPVRAPMPLR